MSQAVSAFQDFQETVRFLYDHLPMFQRIGAPALRLDLANTLALCELLGNPHQQFRSVHVGGTNGKGSTSHMLASILQSAGYRTGLYTSPHLKSFTERIRINGVEIEEEAVVKFVNKIYPHIESIRPSFFEITVAMAFDYFAQQKVDVAVIEVGLGGRLDSTNVIRPEVSVITNIGWDHMDLLGDTLPAIAAEKAGIIKEAIPVVVSERQEEVAGVFEQMASKNRAPLYFADENLSVQVADIQNQQGMNILQNGSIIHSGVNLPLKGIYQNKNILGVIQTVHVLREKGWNISDDSIRSGLELVLVQTGLKGRWQQIDVRPAVICDTGHNLNGIKIVLQQLKVQQYDKLFFVFGMVKGKDVSSILELLPKEAQYFFCQAKIPRALDAELLMQQAKEHGLNGEVVHDVNRAIARARQVAKSNDLIFVGGSTYVVAEINNL